MARGTYVIAAASLLTLSSCGYFNRLTREKAQSLIDSNAAFTSVSTLPLATPVEAIAGGKREGLWRIRGNDLSPSVELTPAGSKHFKSVVYQPPLVAELATAAPLRRKVKEITGIKEVDKTTREVEFVWVFDGLTPVVGRYTGIPPSTIWAEGHAQFKMYDDGWRVEEISAPMRIGGTPEGKIVDSASPFQADPAAEAAYAKALTDRLVPLLTQDLGTWAGGLKSLMIGLAGLAGGGSPEVFIEFQRGEDQRLQGSITYTPCGALTQATLQGTETDTLFFTQDIQRQPFNCGAINMDLRDTLAVRLEGDRLEVQWLSRGIVGQWVPQCSASMARRDTVD